MAVYGVDREGKYLHRHILTIGGAFISHSVLIEQAQAVGLGSRGYVQGVKATPQDRSNVCHYFAVNAVQYAHAHLATDMRIIPFTYSKNWSV
jgi:hypothetical protein